MTLRLTPKQYKTLVKMAWISSRVAQGSEQPDSDTVENILQLTDHICSAAPDFDAEDLFEMVESTDNTGSDFSVGTPPPLSIRLNSAIESELLSIIEWFEEFSFWDVLEDRLAMRDIAEERSEAQWNWLPEAEKDRIYDKYLEYYFEAFSETGVASLRLVEPKPGQPRTPLGWSDGSSPEKPAPGTEPGHRPAKIIEFPGSSDGKPPKKPL